MYSFRFPRLWLTLSWLLIALIVFLSLSPKVPDVMHFNHSDKLQHLAAYLVLSLWLANIYPKDRHRLSLALGCVAMGVCLEVLQGLSGYRTFEYADMLANGIGVLLGWTLGKTLLPTCLLKVDRWLFCTVERVKAC